MSEYEYLFNRRCDVRQRVLANRIYYQERQRIFEFREGLIKVVSILAGSYAFAKVADSTIVGWCAIAITTSSAASLVFGFGTKARDSAKRSSEWAMLERDIELAGERHFTEDQLSQWASRCNEIEAGEPAAHPGLFERANHRACEAMGSKPGKSRGGGCIGPRSLFPKQVPPFERPAITRVFLRRHDQPDGFRRLVRRRASARFPADAVQYLPPPETLASHLKGEKGTASPSSAPLHFVFSQTG